MTLNKGKLILGLALVVLFAGSFAGFQTQPKQKSLGVFPVGLADSVFSPEGYSLEDAGSKAISDQLRLDKRFSVVPFTRTHPAIQRALNEGSVKAGLLMAPFTGRAEGEFKAVRLGRLMRVELAIAPIIDSYDFDSAKSTAKLVIRYEIYDVKLSKLIGSVGLSAEGKGADEKTAASAAVADIVSKSIPQVIEMMTKPPKTGGQ